MATGKKERLTLRLVVMSAPRKAFSGRSLKDRLEADLSFDLEGRRIVEEADRLHKDSESLLRSAEETLRRLKALEKGTKNTA